MSAAENRVVYEIWSDGAATNDQLWSYDVGTGQSTKLVEIPLNSAVGFSRFQPSISNDGSRLLFRRQRSDGGWEAVVQDFSAGRSKHPTARSKCSRCDSIDSKRIEEVSFRSRCHSIW